jgi:hypothetical protein
VGTLLSFIEGIVGIVGSFIGAMNSMQMTAFLSVVRRWVARIDLFIWPDVPDPPGHGSPKRRGRGRSMR